MRHIYERYDNKNRHNMVIYTCILICNQLYENYKNDYMDIPILICYEFYENKNRPYDHYKY